MANAAEMVSIALEGRDNISPAVKSAEASLNGLDGAAKKIDGSFGTMVATAGKAAVAIGAIAAAGVGAGLAAATSAAMDFEKQISAIAAVSGEGQSGIDALSKAALQLGKDTSFSAQEAAVGMEELIKAGVSIGDVLGGAGKASLDLAAAGAVSVGEAAELSANAMNVFGIEGSNMAHVADVIAGAANASAIGVNDYKFSLAAAGAVAATVGVGFEDLSTAIAVMGQAGIKGSDAGTSLKTMLMNLSPTSNKAKDEMRALGIITEEGGNAFFDAEGKAKSMGDIAQVLQEKMKGLTKEQQLNSLATMFGSDAIRAAAVMAEAGAAGFDEMATAIGKVSAQEVAEERLNNLSGSVEKLKGSAETLAITVGMRLTPFLKGMADSATEGMNRMIVVFEDGWRTLEQVFNGEWAPSDSIDPIVNEIGKIGIVLRDQVIPAVQEGAAYLTGTLIPAAQEIIGVMAEWWEVGVGVVAGLAALSVLSTVAGWVMGAVAAWGTLTGAVAASGSVIGGIVAVLGGPLTLAIVGIAAVVGVLAAAWAGNWFDIQGKTQAAITAISGYINTGMQAWASFWTAHGERITTIASAAWDFVVAGATNALALIGGVITAGMQLISGDWAGAWQTITDTAATIWSGWETQLGAVLTIIGALFAPTWNSITAETQAFLTGITTEIDTQMAAGQAMIDAALAAINGLFTAGWAAIQSVQTAAWNMLSAESQANIIAIQGLFTELWAIALQLWTAGTTAIATMVTAWWAAETAEATQMMTTIGEGFSTAWATFLQLWTAGTTAVATMVTEWWAKESAEATEMMTAISTIIQEQLAPWVTFFVDTFTKIGTEFGNAVTQLGNAAAELGTAIMTSLSNAIGAKVGEIVDMVTGSVRKALEGARSLLNGFSFGGGGAPAGGKTDDFNEYVAMAAKKLGISPEQALAVVGKEGPAGWGAVGSFPTGTSYGPLQLHYAGGPDPQEGMGDRFTRDTGIDLRTDSSIDAHKKAIDYALAQVAQTGDWREWYGADKALPGGRFTPVQRITPQQPQMGNAPQVSQFSMGLPPGEAEAACGPAALAWFMNQTGRTPTGPEARNLAAAAGWDASRGMYGPGALSKALTTAGIGNQLDTTPTAAEVQALAQSGTPFAISTGGTATGPGHYYQVSGGSTAGLDVGGSGTALRGGAGIMSLDQILALSGPMNGIITLAGQMGQSFVTAEGVIGTANDATLLNTTTLANGATVSLTQMGNDVTTTVTNAAGVITGQWTTTVEGLVTGATTAQTGVTTAMTGMSTGTQAAVDVMTANSIVSVANMGTGILTSVTDMAGTTIATTTDMSGQVTSLSATLSSGVALNMADMGTQVTSSVDAMSGNVITTVTDTSGNVVTTTTDMAGNVLDQWVALGTGVTDNQTATSAQIIGTEQTTSQDIRDINLQKNQELLRNQHETGRGLIESVTTDTGVIVERWMLAGGDVETIVRDSNGAVLQDFMTSHAQLIAETDRTQTTLLGTTTDALGRTVEVYREKTGEVVQIVTDEHGNIVEEYETTAQAAEDSIAAIEEFYGSIEEVPEVDLGDVVDEYEKARKAAERYRKEADRAPDPEKGESGRDRVRSRQTGGRIDPGDLFWVGEGGRRELFISDRAGQIIAENDLNYGTTEGFLGIGERADAASKIMVLKQYMNVQATPADMQRHTERAMRKLASEWGVE